MQSQSEEIKSKLDIVDVIREYVNIKPAGVNFRACCPFHNEKTPSFIVSPDKQIWHCFGCGKGGDIFSFVMEIENIDFFETLKVLAPKAGVILKRENPLINSKRNRLYDIVELSKKYFQKVLEGKLGEEALIYLENRNLKTETIKEWEIGYSNDNWDDLILFLKGRGFKEEDIFLSGMSVRKEGTNRFYNRFRGRIMFPINDAGGNTLGFTGRLTPEKEKVEKMGKYVNSPQTMIFDKSKILYGLDKAKIYIKNYDSAIIVEGQMDVITAHQSGIKNVIASSGTALTSEQIKLLQRYTNNFIFSLDSDEAGQTAIGRGEEVIRESDYKEVIFSNRDGKMQRYIDPSLSYQINIKVLEIPGGKDPDESLKNNPEDFKKAISEAKPIMKYYFENVFNSIDISTSEGRRMAAKRILAKIIKLGDKIEQDYWLKKLSQKIDINENILREAISLNREKIKINRNDFSGNDKKKIIISREEKLSETLISLLLKFPLMLDFVTNNFQPEQLVGINGQLLYKNLLLYYNNIIENNPVNINIDSFFRDFSQWLKDINIGTQVNSNINEDQPKMLNRLALLGDEEFYEYDNLKAKNEIIKIISHLKKNYLLKRMKEIESLIREAEDLKDERTLKELLEEFKLLSGEIKVL